MHTPYYLNVTFVVDRREVERSVLRWRHSAADRGSVPVGDGKRTER